MNVILTKSTTPIIGWICDLFGFIINGIYTGLEAIGIPNIGLAIIFYTILVWMLLTPLQIKQQKFSKMNAVMQPEIQKIQKKYKNKRDQVSQQRMQEETMAVYEKYGVSPTGSCGQLLIQFPLIIALYQIIYRIPAYISSVRAIFDGLVEKILGVNGFVDVVNEFITTNKISTTQLTEGSAQINNQLVDFLYKLNPSQWVKLADVDKFSSFTDTISSTAMRSAEVNQFLGMDISDTPWNIIRDSFSSHSWLLLIAAVLIPVLAWFTQWINTQMIQKATMGGSNNEENTMMNSMKTVNTIMPLMSAVFCLSLSVGIGIYWIAGAVVRCFQQIIINKHMAKVDVDQLIKKNQEKAAKKRAKKGTAPERIAQQAKQNVRNIENKRDGRQVDDAAVERANEYYKNADLKAGSLAAKANMVRKFDEKNTKKK
ncbi:MAG TPA: YidC/Oxa1 family membrane protein insertase [Candidatus Egerieimonas intestinavium]|uniref:YidC/Oxa1 family membrane protein insertase n=1 Tax=Candidatus Egerieimonas intestinavium TaxID=2840777 RepID=A0A9D1ELK0_9FIRM|nr:YidC/Oxa1 family membrane protein insertase [Candidatus Egerieimonas intestinavium]